jgi:prolyl 4-hydroxylase
VLTGRAFREELEAEDVATFDDFLSWTELQQIRFELGFTHWWHSSVVRYNGREDSPAYFSDIRVSQTSGQIWFSDQLMACLTPIEQRLAELLGTPVCCFEEWQATQYEASNHFDYHVDCGNWEGSAAGERKRSILIYVDAPEQGGETHFRALNRTIDPKPGRLLVWNNLLPSGKCNFAMIHAGLPVIRGSKTIFVTWERERPLRPIEESDHAISQAER